MTEKLSIKLFGKNTVLIQWNPSSDLDILPQVLSLNDYLKEIYVDKIIDLVPSYNSIGIFLKSSVDVNRFIGLLRNDITKFNFVWNNKNSILHEIPVCYDKEFAPDLEEVSKVNDIKIDTIIELHTKPIYRVAFIGFLPGFPYLTGLNPLLHINRKANPRENVNKGSVGIGGAQTGIYTMDSPGGWNIIGRTPTKLFDINNTRPSLLKAGDQVKFIKVSKSQYLQLTEDNSHSFL